ncbi:6267_t:CDS:1, partial [Ambispora leptoticha]
MLPLVTTQTIRDHPYHDAIERSSGRKNSNNIIISPGTVLVTLTSNNAKVSYNFSTRIFDYKKTT